MLIYGIRHSFSVFFPPILSEFGWSRGSTAMMLSLFLLVYGLVAPFAGGLADHWKPRRVMRIGLAIVVIATAGCAFANELWHFYILFGVFIPIGSALCGWPIIAPALSQWFHKKRGLVIGLGQSGGGLSYTYGLFAEFVISILGWRQAYWVLAGVLLALVFPLYHLFYFSPNKKGMTAYGAVEEINPKDKVYERAAIEDSVYKDWTLRKAMKTYQLWLLILSYALYWGVGNYLVLAHQVKFAEDVGYSTGFAASIFALFGIFMVAGQLSSSISDWIGREQTMVLATTLSIGALVALLLVKDTSQPFLLYIYAAFFGFGGGLCAPTVVAGTADLFHGRNFGSIAGILLTGVGVGGVMGPWLGGYIYDVTGSYTTAFTICIVCIVLACLAFLIAAPRKAHLFRSTNT
ncbi:MFS transporter [Chloroflexota bacterium]